jgi:hypothetical protein
METAAQMFVVFGIPAVVLVIAAQFRHRERMRVMEIANAAIARQQPLPPEVLRVLAGTKPPPSGSADLRRGAFLIAIGIALFVIGLCLLVALATTGTNGAVAAGVGAAGVGAIPLAIGIALVILSRVEARDIAP